MHLAYTYTSAYTAQTYYPNVKFHIMEAKDFIFPICSKIFKIYYIQEHLGVSYD